MSVCRSSLTSVRCDTRCWRRNLSFWCGSTLGLCSIASYSWLETWDRFWLPPSVRFTTLPSLPYRNFTVLVLRASFSKYSSYWPCRYLALMLLLRGTRFTVSSPAQALSSWKPGRHHPAPLLLGDVSSHFGDSACWYKRNGDEGIFWFSPLNKRQHLWPFQLHCSVRCWVTGRAPVTLDIIATRVTLTFLPFFVNCPPNLQINLWCL